MNYPKILLLFFTVFISSAFATKSQDALFRSCIEALKPYNFQCASEYAMGKGLRISRCQCWSPEYIASFYECAKETPGTKPNEMGKAIRTMIYMCEKDNLRVGLTEHDVQHIYENGTRYFVNAEELGDPEHLLMHKVTICTPVRLPTDVMAEYFHTCASWFFTVYSGALFGGLILAYFGFVLVCGMIANFTKRVFPKQVKSIANSSLVLKFRGKIAYPALFGYRHSVPFKALGGFINMSVPTRAQGVVLTGYFIMFIIFNFVKYEFFDNNRPFLGPAHQISRVIGDRTGIMASAHLPLIFLFAGRNNIMLTLTNWSYDTMNVYHRWVSRGMYVLVVIHAISFTIAFKIEGYYESEFARSPNVWGITAGVCGGFMIFFAARTFRVNFYEWFLWFHRIMAIFFICGMVYHTKTHSQSYNEFVWASVAIWVLDRFLRIIRIMASSVTAKAECKVYPEEIVKVKIDYSNFWGPSPGDYVFVYFMKPVFGRWENHPFTTYPSPVPGEEKKLVMCIRAREGKTRQLHNYICNMPKREMSCHVLLDGPYGQRFPIENNDSILLIAGGIGVTATYSYAAKLRALGERKQIIFLWTIRSLENLLFFKEELEFLLKDDRIQVQIFLSESSGSASPVINEKGTTDSSSPVPIPINISSLNEKYGAEIPESFMSRVIYGRPNLPEIVHHHVSSTDGSSGVLVCGPPTMNDDVRAAVTKEINESKRQVDLYVEAFNW